MAVDLGRSASNPALVLLDSPAHRFPSSRSSSLFPPCYPSSGFPAACQTISQARIAILSAQGSSRLNMRSSSSWITRCSGSSSSQDSAEDSKSSTEEKVPFGYTRKDVLLIGLGVTLLGVGLKTGLEFAGVDPLKAGNVVQLVMVLGLTIGWISTYIFRVSNKDMTYAQQLRDYENKVMEKRLESLTEAELQVLLEQVEEEKGRLANGEQLLK
ncbi:uncharacterized protein [Typha latifolia]|uniref:uncharacterized protein n=1 Tax=Typha latifolia TaxID=4733 RepID=UPI003C2F1B01